jgi:hypothetical protein
VDDESGSGLTSGYDANISHAVIVLRAYPLTHNRGAGLSIVPALTTFLSTPFVLGSNQILS